MKARTIFALLTAGILSAVLQFCSETPGDAVLPPQSVDRFALERAALQDRYVASELEPLNDAETDPVEIDSHRRDSVHRIKLVRKTRVVERTSEIMQSDDSLTVLVLRKETSGEALIHIPSSAVSPNGKYFFRKPLAESFSRKVVFFHSLYKTGHDDGSTLKGTVSGLSADCEAMRGSFTVSGGNSSALIFFTAATEFDDNSCSTLRNGEVVSVKIRAPFTDSLGVQGWLAAEIEREDDDDGDGHDRGHWKKAALSLLEGGTDVRSARITEVRIAFSDTNIITVRSPLDTYFYFSMLRSLFPVCRLKSPVRIGVTVESTKPDPEIVLVRRGNVERGSVSMKKQLSLVSSTGSDGVYLRQYELTIPLHDRGGKYHSILEVWTHESLYDSTAQVSTHVWGIPYSVH